MSGKDRVGCLYTLRHHLFVPATGSSEVAALMEELHIRPLPREGEPTVLREAEEIRLLVIDEVRDAALLVQCHLELVKGLGPSAPALAKVPEPPVLPLLHPPNNLRQKTLERSVSSSSHNRRGSSCSAIILS